MEKHKQIFDLGGRVLSEGRIGGPAAKRNLLIRSVAAVLLGWILAGCGSSATNSPDMVEQDMEMCPEVRPQVCTMDYTPVCGTTISGREIFSNGCSACANSEVIGYAAGECDS